MVVGSDDGSGEGPDVGVLDGGGEGPLVGTAVAVGPGEGGAEGCADGTGDTDGAGVGIGEGILCSRKGDAYLAHWLKSYRSVVGCSVVGLGDGRPVGSAEG